MELRVAQDSDWPDIWPLWQRIVAAGESYTWPRDTDEPTGRALWMLPPPARVFLAESAGKVLGTAVLRPMHPGLGDHLANASFMVDPDSVGHGTGRRLGEYVLDQARAAGYLAMQFSAVVETNERAVRLWRSLGFDILATVPRSFRHPVHGLVGMHIMYREL